MKGWWPLNDGKGQTVRDWSGNGNHGYLGSTTGVDANGPSWIKGIFFGSALSFSGDDYVAAEAVEGSRNAVTTAVANMTRANFMR